MKKFNDKKIFVSDIILPEKEQFEFHCELEI